MKSRYVLLVAAIATANAPTAFSQPEKKPAPDPSVDAKARELFLEGDANYAAGRYEKAIELFEQSYALSQRPDLLFNIANAQERLGQYTEAAATLGRYVAHPAVTDVSSVRERIRRLEQNASEKAERLKREQEQKQKQKPPAGGAQTTTTPVPPPPPPERPSRAPAIITMTVGGVLILGGVGAGLLANSAGDDAAGKCSDSGLCLDGARDDLDRQSQLALVSDISVGVGLATVAVGTYLLIRASGRAETPDGPVAVHAGPTSSGFAVSVAGSF